MAHKFPLMLPIIISASPSLSMSPIAGDECMSPKPSIIHIRLPEEAFNAKR